MSKHLARVNEIQSNYRIQKGELFKRIRISTFAQLVLQVDQVNKMSIGAEDENSEPVVTPRQAKHATFLDVINGTGKGLFSDCSLRVVIKPYRLIQTDFTVIFPLVSFLF